MFLLPFSRHDLRWVYFAFTAVSSIHWRHLGGWYVPLSWACVCCTSFPTVLWIAQCRPLNNEKKRDEYCYHHCLHWQQQWFQQSHSSPAQLHQRGQWGPEQSWHQGDCCWRQGVGCCFQPLLRSLTLLLPLSTAGHFSIFTKSYNCFTVYFKGAFLSRKYKYLESEKAHPSRQLEEDAILDSVSSYLRMQHGDQTGQRGCTAARTTHIQQAQTLHSVTKF